MLCCHGMERATVALSGPFSWPRALRMMEEDCWMLQVSRRTAFSINMGCNSLPFKENICTCKGLLLLYIASFTAFKTETLSHQTSLFVHTNHQHRPHSQSIYRTDLKP